MNIEKIASLIKEGRNKKNLTQQELADKLYVTDKAVSNWETGKNIPDRSLIRKIEKVLDIKLIDKIETSRERKRRITKNILFGIMFIILAISVLYTVTNYNKIHIYSINIKCDSLQNGPLYFKTDHKISDGTITTSKNSTIISLNEIINDDVPYQLDYDIKIFSRINDKEDTIYEEKNFKGRTVTIPRKLSKKDIENLYIDISYTFYDGREVTNEFKVEAAKIISNDKIIYKEKEPIEKEYDKEKIQLLKNNGYYEVLKNEYRKNFENGYYKYNIETKYLYVYTIKDGIEFYGSKSNDTKLISYIAKKNGEIISHQISWSSENRIYTDYMNELMKECKNIDC